MKEDKQLRNDMSGTTAVIVLIREGVVYCVSELIGKVKSKYLASYNLS